jgi:hypothetical protein
MIEILEPNRKTIEVVGSGNSGSVVGVEKPYLVHDKPPLKSGIGYMRSRLWSGQIVSYYEGDEGWQWQRGDFDDFNTVNCEYIQTLDMDAIKPFTRLKYPNKFGNYDRFTSIDGNQIYNEVPNIFPINASAVKHKLIVDNLYNIAHIIRDGNYSYQNDSHVTNGFNIAANYTIYGLDNFRVTSLNVLANLRDNNLQSDLMNYPPFNWTMGGAVVNTSTLLNNSNVYSFYSNDLRLFRYNTWHAYNYTFCCNIDD